MKQKLSIFNETNEHIRKNYNSNFYVDKVGWATSVWIKEICKTVERRLKELEKDKVDWEI